MSNNYVLDDAQVSWLREQLHFTIRTSRYLIKSFSKRGAEEAWKKQIEGLEQRTAFYQQFLGAIGDSGSSQHPPFRAQRDRPGDKGVSDSPSPQRKRQSQGRAGKVERGSHQLSLPINS